MMTALRKKLQDKLRRKYGYKTNTNYGRGTVLEKIDGDTYFCVVMDHHIYKVPYGDSDILIAYYDKDDNLQKECKITLTKEEISLIGKIADEMIKETKDLAAKAN